MSNGTNRTIAELISHLKHLDVQLMVEDEQKASFDAMRLRCTAPEGTLTPALRQELADRKAELISYLHEEKTKARRQNAEDRRKTEGETQKVDHEGQSSLSIPPSSHFPISPIASFPLSFAQQRLWFLYQLAPHNPFYNVPAAIRLTGRLDQTALKRSFEEIVRRHVALRTRFTTLEGQPVQVVQPDLPIELTAIDLHTVAISDRPRISNQLATAEAQQPFNLTTDSLLRVTLLQFAPTESVLLLTLHHIVADGWSLGVLIRELAHCYTAFADGKLPTLPPLAIQYTDFACWQRNWLQGEVLEKQLTYWRKQLRDLPVLDLPSDHPRPAVQTYRGATYPLQISPGLTQALSTLSQQSGTSLFMTVLAAFQTLLYRYTGQDDIAIGSPIANRHRSEWEGLIGFFVNSLVMRSDLSGNPTFRKFLERVRDVALHAYDHQDLPFEKLVEELDPDRDLSRNPLFQVAFALQNAPMQPLELPGLTLEPAPLESGSTRFDLEVHLWEPAHGLRSLWQSQEGLSGFISYSTDLFDRDRIGRLIGHFQTLLEGIVANPDARLSDLPLLTPAEHQQIIFEWGQFLSFKKQEDLHLTYEVSLFKEDLGEPIQNICFHHIFEAHVAQTPDAIALVFEQESLTYRELNQRADDLAQTLKQLGVHADSLIGLCVDRSADMVIGILGILKAGGAYVPLDPTYPGDRLRFMLTDTQVSILLTQSWLVEALPISPAKLICLDQPLPLIAPLDIQVVHEQKGSHRLSMSGDLENTSTPDQLAYVIYTSGSTGIPKGVLLSHRGLCNVVEAQQHTFHPSRHSRILQFSSLSFDASIFEIALAFGSGGTLYIPPKSAQLPGTALVQFLNDNAITHALLTPAVLAVLPPAELPALQVLITGGEACSSQVIDRWAANRHFFNAYGPTETTIWATVAELHPGDSPRTIGHPIPNTQVYILDAHLNPVPAGIPGELYIGGEGLARGYLNRPELTAERFITLITPEFKRSSALSTQHSILYKTGDRALFQPNGTIQFLGRVDHQIKLRGFRVELGEIEATLQRHPTIQDAVVIPAGETSGASSNDMRLIAYFTLNLQHIQPTLLQSLHTQHLQHWQTLYNQTYQPQIIHRPLAITNPQFNITGWNSSYTGEPIPPEHMQEWVNDRVQQILALQPKRVLEIGCGTGLLLFQLAPHCQTYVGTDFSTVSLESIQNQLDVLNLSHVTLLHRIATDFEGIDLASFDVVILNSIVQYFPSQDYLIQVLEGAIQRLASKGVLFVGDVRSLPLLTAFHTWVQFCRADADMERSQLRHHVERSQFEEPELVIDPMFFHALRDRFPKIRQAQIRLSRGHNSNEMTQFRYNVLLHLDDSDIDTDEPIAYTPNTIQETNWKRIPTPVEEIKQQLIVTKPESLLITNIKNSRISTAIEVKNWLGNQKSPKTVGQMREILQNSAKFEICQNDLNCGIDPQDWWDLEAIVPYTIEITWSTPTDTGDYDVLLIRCDIKPINFPVSPIPTHSTHSYTNNPLQSNIARQLIPELRHDLEQTLPNYMVPSAFIPLGTLARTTNGKVDRRAMPTFIEQEIQSPCPTNIPLTPIESILVDIWKELLRIKHVNRYDNFFELGGHSLLATQMTSRVRDVLVLELPLKHVFEAPTIAQLAPILETLRDNTSPPSIPPLVRLDRSAYRRKQLSSQSSIPPALSTSALSTNQNEIQNPKSKIQNPPISVIPKQSVIASRSPLIPLTLGNSKHPFFCVHPMFGVVFPYLELAQHLGNHHSFYGLQPLSLDGKSPTLNQIEAIATCYIQAIQTLQPQGPYYLGGWSFGGLVAFEMAQQLTKAGQEIGLLAILDTIAPCHNPPFHQSLKFLLGTALWSTVPFLLDYGALVTARLQSWHPWFSRWQWSPLTSDTALRAIAHLMPTEARLRLLDESALSPLLRIVYANAQAAYRYTPQPYPDRITLFKASEQPDGMEHNPTLGWSALAKDIQLHHVPGNHLSLLKHPHVQILAQQLGQYLS